MFQAREEEQVQKLETEIQQHIEKQKTEAGWNSAVWPGFLKGRLLNLKCTRPFSIAFNKLQHRYTLP